jgi:hypothetical protein
VPKRIQLPSADELFQLPGPVSGAPEPASTPKHNPRAKKAPSRRPRAPAAAVSHLDRVESSLRDLPIDTLIDLRDGLEDLLISERVDAGDLEQLLASIGV